jgi:hypothetical protein
MLSRTDRFGLDMDVDGLVRNTNFDMPGFSVSSPAWSTTHVSRILRLYLKYKKHASNVKLHMDCKNLKTQQNIHNLVQYWAHLFPTLDKLISAGHKLSLQTAPGHEFEIKREELTFDYWMQKFPLR